MYNEDESVVITFNGEIYEYSTLMDELCAAGHVFSTRCDTEVIIHAWEEWGESCLEHINGMFAFAIWDRNRNSLFLARDRFGKKPLYYMMLPDGHVAFASELKALMVHPKFDRTLDEQAIEDYMGLGYVPDPKTIFRSVRKLAPGHFLRLEPGQKPGQPRQYWTIRFSYKKDSRSEQEIESELLHRFRESVTKRMVADVPLGAFLSGGVDSSAVVAMMSAASEEPVNTCSISFGNPDYNEARYAQILAEQYQTNHHVEQVDSDDFDLIDKIPAIYDEPFADSSAIPTYRVCELARKHVTVALSGDGGDEVFAGYRRYRWHMNENRIRSAIPKWVRKNLFGTAGSVYPKLDWAPRIFRAKSTLQAIARDNLEAYHHSVSILPNDLHGKLFSREFLRNLQGYSSFEVFKDHADRSGIEDPLSLVQYIDMQTYLPGDILTKVDRASMAHSLEVRVPLLDADFASWVSTLPPSLKLKGQQGKYIFKKVLNGTVPDSILYREKMGFAVPLEHWFRGPLKAALKERLLGGNMRDSEIFDMRFVERIVDQHIKGTRNHSPPIWALLVFEGFLRRAIT